MTFDQKFSIEYEKNRACSPSQSDVSPMFTGVWDLSKDGKIVFFILVFIRLLSEFLEKIQSRFRQVWNFFFFFQNLLPPEWIVAKPKSSVKSPRIGQRSFDGQRLTNCCYLHFGFIRSSVHTALLHTYF